jgi:DNA invertase Pin-like site-specific DNA recombinase
MRCALYGRVSTKDKGQDTENQLTQLRQYAASMGWQIVSEYVDHETGGKADREQFQQMFKAASQRKFDLLLFWSLDRLSREGVLPTLQYLNRLTSYAVGWRSFTEQYLDSTGIFKDAVIGILAAIAKQEKIRISERTKAGLERARSKGKTLGRPKNNLTASQIQSLLDAGNNRQDIAATHKCSLATICRILKTGAAVSASSA